MSKILFVFEGEKTEDTIVRSLETHLLSSKNLIIKCAFGAEIYQLYKEIKTDEDLDIFSLIKERDVNRSEVLKEFDKDDFGEIYLFFDYDAHATLAGSLDQFGNPVVDGDEKLKDLLNFFDNETENGKLYISYPMVEALRHIKDYKTFNELVVKCKGKNCQFRQTCSEKDNCINEPHYKAVVDTENLTALRNVKTYTKEIWSNLIIAHLSKMNFIVNNKYEFPQKEETQKDIFAKQLEKHINHKCPMVAVLSAFPIFVFDYYGDKTSELIK
jgi:hypothetical protein